MIYGIGVDIENIKKFYDFLNKENYIKRIYTKYEINELNKIKNKRRKVEFLASRYAAKEAMSKALGVGISNEFSFKDIEVVKNILGKPEVKYKNFNVHISISHTKEIVTVFIVVENYNRKGEKIDK